MPVPDEIESTETAPPESGDYGESRAANLAVIATPANVYPATPNFPFFLKHYSENWEIGTEGLDGPTWLPELQRDWVVPGVDGKRTIKAEEKPEAAYDRSHLLQTRDGAVILPHLLRYMRERDCQCPRTKRAGTYYHDAFEVPRRVRKGKRPKFRRDMVAYNRFRYELVAQGIIAPPDADIIDEKIARAEYHRDRHDAKVELTEQARERLVETADAKLLEVSTAIVPGDEDAAADKAAAAAEKVAAKKKAAEAKAAMAAEAKAKKEAAKAAKKAAAKAKKEAAKAAEEAETEAAEEASS